MSNLNRSRSAWLGFAAAVMVGWAASPAAGLEFGAGEIVRADGTEIVVPGYSVPSFADWDGDGRKDLVIGEGSGSFPGKVRVYLNEGTAGQPRFSSFSYVQAGGSDLTCSGMGCMGCFPRVVQWDGDAKKDLLIGQADGTIRLFSNVGLDAAPAFAGGTWLEVGPAGAKQRIDVGSRATASFLDWGNDGRDDLVTGGLDGRIHLFVNQGSNASPDFVSESFALANGSNLAVPSGRSSPVVADWTGDGLKDILTGNTAGQLLLYANTGTDAAPSFAGHEYLTADGVAIDLPGSPRSRPSACDWTSDGLPDVLVGSADGKVRLYQSVPEPAGLGLLAVGVAIILRRRPRRGWHAHVCPRGMPTSFRVGMGGDR